MTQAYLCLLRGINVGGNRQVKMVDLKKIYEAAGLQAVRTVLQSGNVLFYSDETDTIALARRLEAAGEAAFGFHADCLVISAANLHAVAAAMPFVNQPDKTPQWIHVHFLAKQPTDEALAALQAYPGPETVVAPAAAVYVYYPEGAGRAKLSNALIEKTLQVRATARNWNTVTKLLAQF